MAEGTVYLVCTSAGEVGVNISADHAICDLSPLESMTQRLGRVNRFGGGEAQVDVVHPAEFDGRTDIDSAREKTLELLKQLPEHDGRYNASPASLTAMLEKLTKDQKESAFSPTPTILPVTDILFDAWTLTTIRDQMPGRPEVTPYLHGISDYDPPQTYVAWRKEVELFAEHKVDNQIACRVVRRVSHRRPRATERNVWKSPGNTSQTAGSSPEEAEGGLRHGGRRT